jgi:alginate O-acetyltransferase complex protein AlgI
MLFNSFTFLIFFLITFSIYYFPPLKKAQVLILVIASLIFYSWSQPYLLILLVLSILINSLTSYMITHDIPEREKFWIILGIIINLSILSLFKYGALLTHLVIDHFDATRPDEGLIYILLHLPLPIGISFYTFEGISLVIDVFTQKKNQRESKSYVSSNLPEHILNTSFFVAFFPHLIAGPILKAKHFYPQIGTKEFKELPWAFVFRSLTVGYFLKVVIADNLKDYTFWIQYPYYQGMGTLTNLTLLFGYSMQIFADFAGYSLIAIGLAASLGYQLPDNFNFPYISRSISEFWRRWHISLSTWLRDYLYFTLGGNRKGNVRTYINLMIVMTLGGLWHGAAWSYGVWGAYHGIGLALERVFSFNKKPTESTDETTVKTPLWWQIIKDSFQVLIVFIFVSLGWLLFKLPRFDQALDFLHTLIRNIHIKPGLSHIVPTLIFSIPVIIYHLPHFPTFQTLKKEDWPKPLHQVWNLSQDVAVGLMLALILLNSGSSQEFIYFQF